MLNYPGGVDKFNRKCLESVFRYTEEWEHLTERIGFWVDLGKAYVTFHKSYVESVWWALAELFNKGLLYKGHKVVWWWAQGGTALSSGEVGNAYKKVDDPSVYVRFPLRDEDASLVVWTTTPWTLPSNMFVAVHAEVDYVYVEHEGQKLILAAALVESLAQKLGAELKVQKTVTGRSLIGRRYRPPLDCFAKDYADDDDRYWRIVPGDLSTSGTPQWFVTLDAGTGIVHVAPAFGEDDWKLWRNQRRQRDLEMLCAVKPDGTFDNRLAPLELEGTWVKDGDKYIIQHLKSKGLLVHSEVYRHDYPFCWRSDNDPLIQYAREVWFVRTTDKIDQVIDNNQHVVWQPEHIKDGRFGDFLGNNVDWALSRERFWGTPLNVWECADCGTAEAMPSCRAIEERNPEAFAEFYEAKKQDPTLSEHLVVHKPWIDRVTIPCRACAGTMHRVPEVIDCWFDSGCMPFAQLGFPHVEGSKELFARAFPADFISEAIDQTRGWFYSLMTISNLVFESQEGVHPYRRSIVLGLVLDKAGKKESKSSGNYTPPDVILDVVRMGFASVGLDAPYAQGLQRPQPGEALIGREDLDGLDIQEGSTVRLYVKDAKHEGLSIVLRVHKKLPRRVLILAEEDRARLGLEDAPADVKPVEVPKLPETQRVWAEYEGMPAPGADAFRWFFFASNPPWNNTRHSLSNVRMLQKDLPIKLRSVYAFFVTYANIDAFDPVVDEHLKSTASERALLDRWILSELERSKLRVVEHMDRFESYEATQVLSSFVEGLSNWYVRRSRERFWAEGREQDKLDAYWTLYQCLHDLSILVAPFLPFAAEDMYQNLVVKPYGVGIPESVHLRLYPGGDESGVDAVLSRDMEDVRSLVSLGLQVRAAQRIKTRQPLKEAEIVLSDQGREAALMSYTDMIRDELNVKEIHFRKKAEDYVNYKVKPNFKLLGKRLGKQMKAAQRAIGEADAGQLCAALETQGSAMVVVEGESLRFSPEELVVSVEAKEGFIAAGDQVGVVVLDTRLDQSLREEGLFREVLSKVQAARKDAQLEFDARIQLNLWTSSETLLAVCQKFRAQLMKETLTVDLTFDSARAGEEVKVDGEVLSVSLSVVSRDPKR